MVLPPSNTFQRGYPLTGTLRSWRDPWGFVVCPDAFEGDLFAHRQNFLGEAPQGDLVGAVVQFERAVDQKGRQHAANIIVMQLAGRQQAVEAKASVGSAPQIIRAGAPQMRSHGPISSELHRAATSQPQTRASAERLQHFVGTTLRGEIRNWKGDWGFLVCPAKFPGDLFVHRQSLQLAADPVPGQQVSFAVAIDQKGRATALEVTDPLPAPEDFIGQGPLNGEIRSWKKQWGFIVAPAVFQGDLFCHQEHLQPEFVELVEDGQLERLVVSRSVTFEVDVDRKGRTCATKVIIGEPVSAAGGAVSSTAPDTTVGAEELRGTLRSWRDPWGFIVCPERFEGDLFVHKDAFVEPPPQTPLRGYHVSFKRRADQRGRVHAAEVVLLGPGPEAVEEANRAAGQGAGRADVVAFGGSEGHPIAAEDGSSTPMGVSKFEHLMGQALTGSARSWKKDWGFLIAPDHFEGDLFVHKGHLAGGAEGLVPGVRVTFEVGADKIGRTSARNVACISDAKDWAGSGIDMQGQVRSFKDPWGFVVSAGAFTGDLFFHKDMIGASFRAQGMTVSAGTEVNFKVQMDQTGRCFASDIRPAIPAIQATKRGPVVALPPQVTKRQRAA